MAQYVLYTQYSSNTANKLRRLKKNFRNRIFWLNHHDNAITTMASIFGCCFDTNIALQQQQQRRPSDSMTRERDREWERWLIQEKKARSHTHIWCNEYFISQFMVYDNVIIEKRVSSILIERNWKKWSQVKAIVWLAHTHKKSLLTFMWIPSQLNPSAHKECYLYTKRIA